MSRPMQCKDCPFNIWFNDLYLSYCDITLQQVEDTDECHCPARCLARLCDEEEDDDQGRAEKL